MLSNFCKGVTVNRNLKLNIQSCAGCSLPYSIPAIYGETNMLKPIDVVQVCKYSAYTNLFLFIFLFMSGLDILFAHSCMSRESQPHIKRLNKSNTISFSICASKIIILVRTRHCPNWEINTSHFNFSAI